MALAEVLIDWTLRLSESNRPVVMPLEESIPREFSDGEWRRVYPRYILSLEHHPRSWMEKGLVQYLLDCLGSIAIPGLDRAYLPMAVCPWEILWALISTKRFLVYEPLRSKLDSSFGVLHDLYQALWEARFRMQEHESPDNAAAFLHRLTSWVGGSEGLIGPAISPSDQLETICLLTTLAHQNGVLGGWAIALEVEGISASVRLDLERAIGAVDRWLPYGCPIGFLISATCH